jgi:hypothetical protein
MKTVSVLAVIGFFAVLGCARETSAPAPVVARPGGEAVQQPGQPAQPGQEPRAPLSQVGIKRVIDRPAVQNDLRQLALLYKTCEAEFGRVRSAEAFKNYIKRDARNLYKALEDNVYVVVPSARADSNTVVAYERAADGADQHIVAMGDGSVRTMSTQQLRAAVPK